MIEALDYIKQSSWAGGQGFDDAYFQVAPIASPYNSAKDPVIPYFALLTSADASPTASMLISWMELALTGAGVVKEWNGSAWVVKPLKVWNGSSWVVKPIKVFNGTGWA